MDHSPEFIETTVVSTRIRLARNLRAYPFPSKMKKSHGEEIVRIVRGALNMLDLKVKEYDTWETTAAQMRLLQEQHIISPALTSKSCGAAFVSENKRLSIMVNEEDHLREQYIVKGFDLKSAFEYMNEIDDGLHKYLDFAYDARLGYLSACPSNVGTGMRASVLMFLPGLARSNALKNLLPSLKANGMTVRGIFGEGTKAEGFSYQVSNERTMGVSEREILEQTSLVTMRLCEMELQEREKMRSGDKLLLKDGCLRAYGLLTNCALLPLKELTDGMVQIKLGLALGFFKAPNAAAFNDFLADMRPASFRLENGLEQASERECDEQRAEIVQRVLP